MRKKAVSIHSKSICLEHSELAVAVAIALFGTTSPAALTTTVGVLTEVPVMLTLVKIANNTKHYFDKNTEVEK